MGKDAGRQQEAAFVMADADRVHRIVISDAVHYPGKPGWTTLLAFFVLRRGDGSYSLVSVAKTFAGDACRDRKVQTKDGLAASGIGQVVTAVTNAFARAIEAASRQTVQWHTLDLAQVTDPAEQRQKIAAWGRVEAWMEAPPEFSGSSAIGQAGPAD
jgi:hypothetical protein